MNKLAKDELISRAHTTLKDMIFEINAVTPQQISQVAQDLFTSEKIALTGLGPLSSQQVKALSGQFQKCPA
jgi:predicted Zn-dependent peptidase